jgi:hypothetical protein
VGRLPAQELLGPRAGGRVVEREDGREEAEVGLRLVGRDRGGGDTQVTADAFGDQPERDAFVTHDVQPRSGRRLLQGQAVPAAGVQGVAGGPAVGAVPR